ncbi:MAG: hypothetical protein V7K98_12965 [Nostoc sp.]
MSFVICHLSFVIRRLSEEKNLLLVPIPNSQFPIPNAQCPMPNAQ